MTHSADAGKSPFDPWAEYYDLIHRGLPGEAEFYIGQALRLAGRTLELGCGTGRLAIPIAMSGVDIFALDNSIRMLEVCTQKYKAVGPIPGKVHLVCADMAAFALNVKFDFIFMAYRTFMHLLTPEEQRRCLRHVHDHLDHDGVFILNVWAARPSAILYVLGTPDELVEVDRYPIGDNGEKVVHYYAAEYDEYRQLLREENRLEIEDSDSTVIETISLPMTRSWLTYREMDNLVRLCGFEPEVVFGDFGCNPFGPVSTEMIWVLRKQK